MTKLDSSSAALDFPRRSQLQLTPDLKYALSISSVPNASWAVYVTPGGSWDPRYSANTELWGIDASFLRAMQAPETGTTLAFGARPFMAPKDPPPVEMPSQSLWTRMKAAPSGCLFFGTNSAGNHVGLSCSLEDGARWGGTLTWYVGTQDGHPPQYAVSEQGITLAYRPASSPGGLTWYTMTLSPLSWRETGRPGQGGALGVALAREGGTLHLAFTSAQDNAVRWSTSGDGANWSPPAATDAVATGGPALASLNGTLYLAYRQQGGHAVRVRVKGSMGWTQAVSPPASTCAPPALAAVAVSSGDVLCLAYLELASSSMKVLTSSGSAWSEPAGPGVAATGAPAIAGFGGRLFLAQLRESSKTIEIYRAYSVATAGTTWSSKPVAVIRVDAADHTVTTDPLESPGGGTLLLSHPGLGTYNGRLYLTFSDVSGKIWICSSSDGARWSGFANVAQQIHAAQSPVNAALAAFVPTAGAPALALACATPSQLSVLTAT